MKFLKKLLCLHLNWVDFDSPSHIDDYAFYPGRGQLIPWTCINCGKVKHFEKHKPPIQWNKK